MMFEVVDPHAFGERIKIGNPKVKRITVREIKQEENIEVERLRERHKKLKEFQDSKPVKGTLIDMNSLLK
jgi:hypothetical protein